ncbi:stalk domain-containing protein [Paenibacillus sp. FSL H8-0332]|uniref:stalk domain-containing protein n=1 Tax=Paenibacillus sp. FSL H8-0332 TaxID=2954742 RepID=UPI0030D0CDE9
MKKFISGFLCGAVLFGVTSAYGAEAYQKVQSLLRNDVKVYSNGAKVALNKPVLSYNGSIYLSVRDVSNIMNKDVLWRPTNQSVEILDKKTAQVTVSPPKDEIKVTVKSLKELTQVFKIDNEVYKLGSNAFIIYEDNNGLLYVDSVSAVGTIVRLLAITYDNYALKTSDNPFVKGEIEADMRSVDNYFKMESNYVSINTNYRIYTLYNSDKTKQYVISDNPNDLQGIVTIEGKKLVPLASVFLTLGVDLKMEKDVTNKLFIFSFQK